MINSLMLVAPAAGAYFRIERNSSEEPNAPAPVEHEPWEALLSRSALPFFF